MAGALVVAVAASPAAPSSSATTDDRYIGEDPVTDAFSAGAADDGLEVGLAGLWDDAGISPVLPAFGPRYGNRVAYVGRDDDDVLRRYDVRARVRRGARARRLRPARDRPRPARGAAGPGARLGRGGGYEPVVESDRLVLLAKG